jgi:hypothetical protein
MSESADTGVTNINDLPSNENVKLDIKENKNTVNMSEIFKEIQGSGQSGNIPSRDIPMNKNNVLLDEPSKPNYVPEHDFYIDEDEFESSADIIETKRKSDNKKASIETMYEELQVPILLGVIYFLFQLPIFNDTMAKYLQFTFNIDGGINLSGIVFKSVLYAILYYVLTKVLTNISE